jgi:salicylate 5-hydroxylase small subunit
MPMQDTAITVDQREKAILRLLQDYVEAVDTKDLDRWTEFFADEASYIVTNQENLARSVEGNTRPVGYAHDHNKDRIHDRVTLIRKAWAGHYDDYQPRHVLSMPVIDLAEDEDTATVRANVSVYITEPSITGSRLLAVGQYRDEVTFTDEGPKFASKLVVLDTNVLPRYFIYPL